MNVKRILFEEIWEHYFVPAKKEELPLTHISNAFVMKMLVLGDYKYL